MKIRKVFIMGMFILMNVISNANPVMPMAISEFYADSAGWWLEIKSNLPEISLDTLYLVFNNDTAYFKEGLMIDAGGYLSINQDDLQTVLPLNLEEGDLQLCIFQSYPVSEFRIYPDTEPYSRSVIDGCYLYDGISHPCEIFYRDISPTPGAENDTLGAMGDIKFSITDMDGNPIPDVNITAVTALTSEGHYFTSDENGFKAYHTIASDLEFKFHKDGYVDTTYSCSIFPDDTINAEIRMQKITRVTEHSTEGIPQQLELIGNYPNPFNNATMFVYRLPRKDYVEIEIYNLEGKLVERLIPGVQDAGTHRVMWKTSEIPSGVYIYRVKTLEFDWVAKCILLK